MCSDVVVFFFKQKTAYEMRISDWSSDVCSSDLIKQQQDGQFGRQVVLVVVDEVADHLDAGGINRLAQRAAQHVEMAVGDAGLEMHARVDHRLAPALAGQAGLDGGQDFVVGERQFLDIETVQVGEVNGRMLPGKLLALRPEKRRVGRECGG